MSANDITKDILLALPKHFLLSWHWRNNRVEAKAIGKGGRKRHLSAGIDGQGDISGLIGIKYAGKIFGVRTEIEVKTTDQQSRKQRAFQLALEKVGGIYVLTRSVEDALGKLDFIVKQLEGPVQSEVGLFYIQDTRQVCGNSAFWWRPDGAGYTCNVDEAWKVPGTWTGRSTDMLRPCAGVDRLTARHFDVQKLSSL